MTGRVVAITGGGSGIGLACSRAFAQVGATVVVGDRDVNALAAAEAALSGNARKSSFLKVDVFDAAERERFFSDARRRVGRIDSLIVVPGYGRFGSLARSDPSDWPSLVTANFLHAAASLHAVIPEMTERGSGTVVFIGTVEGDRAAPGLAIYGAMKAALASLTKTAAVELAPRGIRVNCVAPDMIRSPSVIQAGIFRADPNDPDEVFSNRVTIPLGRKGLPEEVANVVVFLACDLSSYVTGAVIPVTGGTHAAGSWMNWPEGYRNQLPDSVLVAMRGTQ